MRAPLPADELSGRLCSWYDENARDLPWRRSSDTYRIWLSEVMLQQTQVVKVVPYYERFVERFPTVAALAGAPEEEVLGLWSGLGYYSRARNLQRAARRIVEHHDGRFPETLEQALALPGVGRYTAGAVLSIARGRALPVVDGNVRRVLARLLAVDLEPGGELDRLLWRFLEDLFASGVGSRAGRFNQALMELGAIVCRPRSPDCRRCPLEDVCLARRADLVEQLPRPRPRRSTEERHYASAVVRRGDRYLMRRSVDEPYLRGFWEFPRVARGVTEDECAGALARLLGVGVKIDRGLPPIRHQITFRRLFFHPLLVCLVGKPPPDCRWLRPSDSRLPMSSYIGKVVAAVESAGR